MQGNVIHRENHLVPFFYAIENCYCSIVYGDTPEGVFVDEDSIERICTIAVHNIPTIKAGTYISCDMALLCPYRKVQVKVVLPFCYLFVGSGLIIQTFGLVT